MNTIKIILEYRKQKSERVFNHKGGHRSDEAISFTRHLIKYFLYVWNGYSTTTIERHMRSLSDGFHHSSVLHSVNTIRAQEKIFAPMTTEIFDALININNNEIQNKERASLRPIQH